MTHGDDELPPHEDRGVAVDDLVTFETRCANDQKQVIAVSFDLRQMLRVERILDRQRMKPEMLLNAFQRAVVGLVQTNPDEIRWLPDMRDGLGQVDFLDNLAVMIELGSDGAHGFCMPLIWSSSPIICSSFSCSKMISSSARRLT